jgi:hypothetical protein
MEVAAAVDACPELGANLIEPEVLVFRSNHMIQQRGAAGWVEQRKTHPTGILQGEGVESSDASKH